MKCYKCKKLFIKDGKGDDGGLRYYVVKQQKDGGETKGYFESMCNRCIKEYCGNRGYRIMHSKKF